MAILDEIKKNFWSSSFFNKLSFNKGFTLTELLITVGIAGILGAVAVPIYSNLQVQNQLSQTSDFIIQALRLAQQDSKARYHNSAHGVKFLSDRFVSYTGNSYASRNTIYDRIEKINKNINLVTDLNNAEVFFYKSLGRPNNPGAITISYDNYSDSQINIYINEQGMVEIVDDYNYAPIANNDEYETMYKKYLEGNVLDNDEDYDHDPLKAVLDEELPLKLENGTLEKFSKDGSFVYRATSKEGKDKFPYRAYDGHRYSSYATVYIVIDPEFRSYP